MMLNHHAKVISFSEKRANSLYFFTFTLYSRFEPFPFFPFFFSSS